MKKLVFAFCAFLLVGNLSAQDHEKAYKKAKRLLATFNMERNSNADKLEEALLKIDYAFTGDLSGLKNAYDPYLVKGDIYNTIAGIQVAATEAAKTGKENPPGADVKAENPAATAFEAYKKGLQYAKKGSQKSKLLEGLKATQNNITNAGLLAYQNQDFETSFKYFSDGIEIHDLLKANNFSSTLDIESDYDNQLYLAGLAGVNAKKYDEARSVLLRLYEKGTDEAVVYTSLYIIDSRDGDAEAAYTYLEEGRKKFPDDNSLLFSEINHFLKIGKLDELISRLEKAIEVEPDNVSLYTTLGNVYDNLYQTEVKNSGEKEKEYFDKAFQYYTQASEKDPKNVDAAYSMGALYFNKAALVTQEMLKLQDDYSKEAMKKYNGLKKDSEELFNQALPYFKKAESLNANDLNTLIALKEIYARIDDIEKSNEFKTRLQNVQGGGENASSFFNE